MKCNILEYLRNLNIIKCCKSLWPLNHAIFPGWRYPTLNFTNQSQLQTVVTVKFFNTPVQRSCKMNLKVCKRTLNLLSYCAWHPCMQAISLCYFWDHQKHGLHPFYRSSGYVFKPKIKCNMGTWAVSVDQILVPNATDGWNAIYACKNDVKKVVVRCSSRLLCWVDYFVIFIPGNTPIEPTRFDTLCSILSLCCLWLIVHPCM